MKSGIVKELVPKLPSYKATKENYGGLWPFCISDNKNYICFIDYQLIGYCDAPFKGNGPHAIFFEHMSGEITWNHGDAELMIFDVLQF